MSGRRLVLVVGAALGALFLLLAVRSLDWHAFADALAGAKVAWVVPALAAFLAYLAVKAWRWAYLLRPLAHTDTRALLPAVLAGNAGNYVFPHVGEIARASLAGRRLGLRVSALLASVALERLFDFLALLLLVLAVVTPARRLSPELALACQVIGGLSAAMLVAVAAFVARPEACLRIAAALLAPLPARHRDAVLGQLRAAGTGLHAVARPSLLLPILALSLLQWLLVAACMAACLAAVGAPPSLPAVTSALLLNVIGLTLPAAPGHVGTVQLAFTVGLAPFGIDHDLAFAGSVIYNVLIVVVTVALGLPGLRAAWLDLRERLAPR